ncbi:hypothetical protein HanIR_Chr13g0637691 [Helianthus annuus]|nr:hypothetical protein HanIR_Chr13g0637691 [Helianthus annuus]
MFSPYKSNLQREFSEEDQKFETQRKRSERLSEWKWSKVINLDDSEENDKEEELIRRYCRFKHKPEKPD